MTIRPRRKKKPIKNNRNRKLWLKFRKWLMVAAMMAVGYSLGCALAQGGAHMAHALENSKSCPQLEIIFARGSGAPHNQDRNYLEFRKTLETKLKTTSLDYRFTDLDYPAVGVGLNNLSTTVGAYVGSGLAYEFGASVNKGRKKLIETVNGTSCPNTKYVVAGYSQGAMVTSYTYQELKSDKLIYVATFGDPKIYLPEGKGPSPEACRGKNLSDYRKYVPNCQVYEGLLKGFKPYSTEEYQGRVGVWCNKDDIFCTPFMNIKSHTSYVEAGLYEDAARVIFDKINRYFGLNSKVSSPHDTVFLIDSTSSMNSLIEKYKAEALRLARETLAKGGRVALYDYRDLKDPYEPQEHCNFDNCTLEIFEEELGKIQIGGGGDIPESTLAAAFHAMKTLRWNYGSTKSLVILTDANFLSPDRDGTNFNEVVALSKKIDPVNFYIITKPETRKYYEELAMATDGKVATNLGEMSLTVDEILDRYDSLPVVEEGEAVELPTLNIEKIENVDISSVRVKFSSNGAQTLIILNDTILGVTSEEEITIMRLKDEIKNRLVLVPMTDRVKGEGSEIILNEGKNYWEADLSLIDNNASQGLVETADGQFIKLGAPNTGSPH